MHNPVIKMCFEYNDFLHTICIQAFFIQCCYDDVPNVINTDSLPIRKDKVDADSSIGGLPFAVASNQNVFECNDF